MKAINNPAANDFDKSENRPFRNDVGKKAKSLKGSISRRLFLGKSIAMGAGTIGAGLLANASLASEISRPRPTPGPRPGIGGLTAGDAALLRFPAALELLEADFWFQYHQLGG